MIFQMEEDGVFCWGLCLNRWIEYVCADHPIGPIVDAHSIMEVIYSDASSEGIIANAKGLHKIQLDND